MLTASLDNRTITAQPLIPWGEQGRTSLGRVTAEKGAFDVPGDVTSLRLNMEHDRKRPVGRFVSVEETDEGLNATFTVPETTSGDDLLLEISEGLRTGVSIEIENPIIRQGRLLGGVLGGAAAVVDPAFPSAILTASDAGPEISPTLDDPSGEDAEDSAEKETPEMGEPIIPDGDQPPAPVLTASVPQSLGLGVPSTAKLFARLASDNGSRNALLASLDTMTSTDLLPAEQTQWLGEIYAQRTYTRKFATLVQQGNLNGQTYQGWRFVEGKAPVVAAYAGYPNQPNSNEVDTESVTGTASRIAGAHQVDRAFLDFPNPEFWAGYMREGVNSYERILDGLVLASFIDGSTAVTAGTVPTGVSTAAAYLVDGAMSILAAERDLPSFAVVGADLYRDLLLTRADDMLAFLNGALGIEDGAIQNFRIVSSASAGMAGKVLVGARTAATVYELPGSPVRVDAVDIAVGGASRGLFGYHAELINDAKGLALVSAAGTTTTTTTGA